MSKPAPGRPGAASQGVPAGAAQGALDSPSTAAGDTPGAGNAPSSTAGPVPFEAGTSGAPTADDTSLGAHALFTDHSTPPQGLDQQAAAPPADPQPTERPTGNGPAHALADPPTGPLPVIGSPMAEALLKPEALARLSDTDRELLTRLQAELASGGGANGSSGPNGATPA
jgi:hypothetical protein